MKILQAAAALVILASSILAQESVPPDAKPRDDVYVPNAGYRLTVTQLLWERRRSSGHPDAAAPNKPKLIAGNRNIPAIAVSFKNVPGPFPIGDYAKMLFSDPTVTPTRKTLTQYFSDMSNGAFIVQGKVVGWYALPKDDVYYENNDVNEAGVPILLRNGSGKPLGELLKAAFTQADQDIDFAKYDNDGPDDDDPNSGDDDGKVDAVFIIQPEAGAECGGSALKNIWSHKGHYSDPELGQGQPFETRALRLDKNGNVKLKEAGSPQHIVIDDYTIQPAIRCEPPQQLVEVGIFCHEYGHALGLPDLYDRTDDTPSSGLGHHCLMSAGNQGADGKHSDTPTPMSAWARTILGWTKMHTITANDLVRFEPSIASSSVWRFEVPGTGLEYFLVEYRDKDWRDPDGRRFNWDEYLPKSGLAVWHVDDNVGLKFGTWPFAPKDEGQNDSPSKPGEMLPSFAEKHALVALVQADGRMDLERDWNRSDPEDLFTSGSTVRDDPACRKGTRSYNGKATGLSLTDIDFAARTLRARIDDLPPSLEAASVAVAAMEPVPVHASSTTMRVARYQEPPPPPLAPPAAPAGENSTENLNESEPIEISSKKYKTTLQALLKSSPSTKIYDRYDDKLAEQITGLSLPVKGDRSSDAMQKFEKTLKNLIGDVPLNQVNRATTATAQSLHYEQLLDVSGKRLPLFDHEVVFHYGGDYLKAVTSSIIEPQTLVVTGKDTGMTSEEARAVARSVLGIPSERISDVREGVFAETDSKNGRIAYQLTIAMGEGQERIRVYVDQDTRKILGIR
jgi:M6 family metalloprotease-like protein